jgi:hypothetical protein
MIAYIFRNRLLCIFVVSSMLRMVQAETLLQKVQRAGQSAAAQKTGQHEALFKSVGKNESDLRAIEAALLDGQTASATRILDQTLGSLQGEERENFLRKAQELGSMLAQNLDTIAASDIIKSEKEQKIGKGLMITGGIGLG